MTWHWFIRQPSALTAACRGLLGRRGSASVGVSGSVSDQRSAASVGDLRERARHVTRGARTPSRHPFRLPRTAHELAHALAHAARDPLSAARLFRRPIVSRQAPASGFTLIEVMLALAIMTFVTALLWGSFSQTARVKKRMEDAQERTHTIRVALMRMSREVEMAFLSLSEKIGVEEKRTMFVGTTHADLDELRFSWFGHQRLRADRPEADTAVVSYFSEPDPDDRMITNLMRRETRRLESKDPTKIPGETYVLCPAVASVKFSYYDYKKKEWKQEWNTMGADGLQYLPTQVRISLTVIDERGQAATFTSTARLQVTERVDYRPGRA